MSMRDRIVPALNKYFEASGLSVREFARRVSVTEGSIRHYLSGRQVPPLDKLEKMAEVLGVNPFLFLVGTRDMPLVEQLVLAAEDLSDPDLEMIRTLLSRLLQDRREA